MQKQINFADDIRNFYFSNKLAAKPGIQRAGQTRQSIGSDTVI